jgi:peptide-methionine (S)-S-oxide reductase
MTDDPAARRPEDDGSLERATLGGGCFWCLDAVYRRMEGVREVICGYAGGHAPHPSYEDVCTGTTGHAEVVQIAYDPAVLPFRDLLEIFFTIHEPTTRDRQGGDVGPQYRSIILHHSEAQREEAEAVMAGVTASGIWDAPLVTQLEPLEVFHPAEPEHQDYFTRNPHTGYCQAVVGPKVAKARSAFAHRFLG